MATRQRKYQPYILIVLAACFTLNILWWFAARSTSVEEEIKIRYPLNICDVAIGITTTAAYKDRVQMQEKTWIKQMCSTKSNYRFITDEKLDDNNYVFSSCPNDYNSVCCKTADLVHKMLDIFPQKNWFMKCDDDSYVVPERVVDYLSTLDPKQPILTGLPYYIVLDNMCTVPRTRHNCTAGSRRPHIGREWNYTMHDNFAYPAGGPCYAFSNELARRMVNYNVTKQYSKYCNTEAPFEDLMISRIAHDVSGYVVDGSRYFDEDPAEKSSVKSDKTCCYHMWNNEWKKMDKIHGVLHPED